jgi:ABC-type nitrate/sulfonate/bicarbonate transport system substrate-binding protein
MSILSRRTSIRLLSGALASAVFLPGTLSHRTHAAESPKKVTFALDWTPNTNHIGLFVAQKKGFFSNAGVDVAILPYSDTAAGTLVSNGRADFGIVGVGFFALKAAGADLRAVYAVAQSDTGRLIVDATRSKVIRPRDLDGLTYGGFGSAWEHALISTIIKYDGGKGEFKTVTLGTSAYEALSNGAVDFTLEVSTWEGVQAALAGEKLREFKYSDYGVPDEHTTMIASSDAYLRSHAEIASAFLGAVTRGYAYAVDHPGEAADILIAANRAALTNPKLVHASMDALVKGRYLRTADGVIGKLDPAKIEGIGNYLFESGILLDENGSRLVRAPDFTTYYSNYYLPKS